MTPDAQVVESLLDVRGLCVEFATDDGTVRAVDGVDFSVRRGEIMAVVGESGCGKSVTALSIMRLIAEPPGHIEGGEILFHDPMTQSVVDLRTLDEKAMRRVRGGRIAMIFQEPMTSLNPVFTIGAQIIETIRLHRRATRREAMEIAADALRDVGMSDPRRRLNDYPHALSGGMRQRVLIAMALVGNPALLIADEPTTALDVTVQSQIIELLMRLRDERGMGMMFITHDLGVVARMADRVCVLYAGRTVETCPVGPLFAEPLHPYTQGLLRCLPGLSGESGRLETIPGTVPNPVRFPDGCRYHPRCAATRLRGEDGSRRTMTVSTGNESAAVLARCVRDDDAEAGGRPTLREVRKGRWVACWETDGYDLVKSNPEIP